jgi:hypothetical protein
MEDADHIKRVAEYFYRKLLGISSVKFDEQKAIRVEHLIKKKISYDHAAAMCTEVTAEEIRKTIFRMNSNKVLGPDGY